MKRLVPLVLMAALAGCGGGEDSASPTTATTADAAPLVVYERSGGVAAMPQALTVKDDGSATVEAGVDPARQFFDLGDEELEQLRSELEAAKFDEIPEPPEPSGCADCYVHRITYGPRTISFEEGTTPVPGSVVDLVAHLGEITAAHYPPDAGDPPIVN